MRVGLTVWDSRISPVADAASEVLVVRRDDAEWVSEDRVRLPNGGHGRAAAAISALDLDVLVCGAVSRRFAAMLEQGPEEDAPRLGPLDDEATVPALLVIIDGDVVLGSKAVLDSVRCAIELRYLPPRTRDLDDEQRRPHERRFGRDRRNTLPSELREDPLL